MDPTKLSKNKMLLTGIGEAQVTTIGSFEHKFKIDDENYSLTWHVVPTDKLKFEAVIGSDLLKQASINFTKEGVEFNKYENHAQLMQISAENLQEELDLSHVENRQIKKELEKLIQDYKPEKTASTDVTMRTILKDEEPVCQHPRRLAFTERQNKDGSSRMCIDYRKLNQKLLKDKFSLPIIEDVLDTLQEAKVYSTLDLRNGFFHVDVDEDCRKYTSFIVPDGQFEFNKVPFGLSTSPGVFQRYALQLEEFDYEIEHRAGSRMKHVDALSRYPVMMVCNDTLTSKLKKAQEEDDNIQTFKSLLEKQESEEFFERNEQREFLKNDAKKNIETLQSENRKTYNRRRKKASLYKEGDLVAIQRTQFGAGLKLRPKFLSPYKVTKFNSKDRYEVEKVGQHDGPNSTTTSADLMKHFYA
ncbi:retrovirus-related Pol polyprotein from transposon 412 [Trichonephila clavipes]|nr:retrovirus-related Pol polyprotein from transposon 412 [Trichonephila clavipes]